MGISDRYDHSADVTRPSEPDHDLSGQPKLGGLVAASTYIAPRAISQPFVALQPVTGLPGG